ncbi:aldo-keto reductase family protein [Desulfosarcina cetonica]
MAGGLLSGKYDRDGRGPDGARRVDFDFPPVNKDRAFDFPEPPADESPKETTTRHDSPL